MAAKGSDEKIVVTKGILEKFEGAFVYNDGKEIRIPIGDVQIKVALTCAKENVSPDGATVLDADADGDFPAPRGEVAPPKFAEPTQEEKEKVQSILAKLNF